MKEIVNYLVSTIGEWGYIGIFLLMFLESSFFPFPSEVIMIPAGYLAYKGDISLWLAILIGVLGSYSGAIFNYFLARKYGRSFLLKYGKYFFIKRTTLEKLDLFFEKHGHISTFNGRLIPGIRQYISLPAGIAKMNVLKFSIYTSLGATIWVSILTFLGYYIGKNESLIKKELHTITIIAIIFVVFTTVIYVIIKKRKSGK